MGLLDYYRQFEAMTAEEISERLRVDARQRREQALARVETIDLSSTTWPELPHSEVVNAVIHTARGWAINRPPDRHAERLRRALGDALAVEPGQIAVANGAAELLGHVTDALLGEGDELVTPWPSYPLIPLLARRSGARAVAVDAFDADALLAAVTRRTRLLVICNPNDPTGAFLGAETLAGLLERLPDTITVVLDEALRDFVDAELVEATIALLERFPRLLLVRTFSKAWGLAGLRVGYAIGAPQAADVLARLAPPLGVGVLSQSAAIEALNRHPALVAARRAAVIEGRGRIVDALHGLAADAPASQANLVWLAAAGLTGSELAARLERQGVRVADGAPLGADDHVRAAIQTPAAVDRLLLAIERALDQRPTSPESSAR